MLEISFFQFFQKGEKSMQCQSVHQRDAVASTCRRHVTSLIMEAKKCQKASVMLQKLFGYDSVWKIFGYNFFGNIKV